MKWLLITLGILALIAGYSYVTVSNGPIEPLGRLSFVKLANPDMYPGHPDSELLVKYAEERGSKCALVVHFTGSSNYRSYNDSGVYIIEVGFIDTQGMGSINMSQVNYLDSFKVALFGIPDGRYKYMSDGHVYDTYDEMMAHVNELAQEHGQEGPLPTCSRTWPGGPASTGMAWNCQAGQPNSSSRMRIPTVFSDINPNLWNNSCICIYN